MKANPGCYHFMITAFFIAVLSGCEKNNANSARSADPALGNVNRNSSFTTPTVPPPADSAGYNRLTFCDDFDSLGTIDIHRTKAAGFKWYTERPNTHDTSITANFTDTAGVLTIKPIIETYNLNLTSYSPHGGHGQTFTYGYFEARMRFDPRNGPNSAGWPSFWSLSNKHLTTNNTDGTPWAEVDFFEAYTGQFKPYNGGFYGSFIDWLNVSTKYSNSNNYHTNTGVDYSQWHTYGCLWKPGRVTYYFDGVAMMTQHYSATGDPQPRARQTTNITDTTQIGVFHVLDTEPSGMTLILGTGINWPLQVDWVHAWQN